MNDIEVLQIKWDSGQMSVYMDAFFPCSIERLKKLLKIIRLDWENEDDLILQLKRFLEDKITECENMAIVCPIESKNHLKQAEKYRKLWLLIIGKRK